MDKKKVAARSKSKTGKPKKEKKAAADEEGKLQGFDRSPGDEPAELVAAAKAPPATQLEDIKEIERRMEAKIQQFQSKMKELDKARIQPITLQLIQKYSFTRKFKSQLTNA